MREQRGCQKPAESVVYESDRDEWYFCPVSIVHQYVSMWHDSYLYAEQFGGIPYEKQSAKWIEAAAYFRGRLAALKDYHRPVSRTGLSALKGALNG